MNRDPGAMRRRRWDRQRGQSLVMAPFMLVILLSMSALVIDLGNLYVSYQQLEEATQAAALAGAQPLNTGTAAQAQAAANQYSAAGTTDYNAHPNLINVSMVAGYPKVECLKTTGIVCYASSGANAIVVQEKATVNTFFARVFGVKQLTIYATATASAKGGGRAPYNVMMVLDTTASMGNTTDANCTVPGISGAPTPEECAQYGIQQLLGQLDPCPMSLASCGAVTGGNVKNPVDMVGLMAFPGLTPSETSTLTSPPVAAAGASGDYSCPTSAPSTVPYNENPGYLILPLQSDYRTSDTATKLNGGSSGSNLVKAVGAGVGSCSGVTTPGGQGTFYAGAIAAAQSYLTANTRTGAKNVMILLSDGNAGASSSQMAGTATSYSTSAQCQQAVTAATNAKGAGILVYSVSYGSETTGCSTGDTLTPCQAMYDIATSPPSTYFFSVPNSGSTGGTVCSGARATTSLDQVFNDIAGDLTVARLIPNGTT